MRALLPFAWSRLPAAVAPLRKAFYCADLFETRVRYVPCPSRPSCLLFTSQNGVRAYLAQDWVFEEVPAYCVGQETFALAKMKGLKAHFLGAPPALDLMETFPKDQALWLSGAHIAADLQVPRIPIYDRHIRSFVEAQALEVVQSNQIRNVFLTSGQLISWVQCKGLFFQGAAVLSERLAAIAKADLPMLEQLWIVPDFESGVRTLYASSFEEKGFDHERA